MFVLYSYLPSNISVGAFNGKIDKVGEDDTIDSVVVSIAARPFEKVMIGAS
ncbi:MAG: hypothetical protein QNK29_02775 [Desulfobacterales bacterium]|uniref:hypothetical protein n=1 Tax=Desulfosarcina sp. TaxID=2027861 RepID=UPI0029B246DF|nr:hypothetical protein [Desulfosarcina sp.]MDX2446107.1 hypothetical protein [Desulfobacterales bacterium]MDX2489649.1 hypothetical protein [Desulfosarcina sp.]